MARKILPLLLFAAVIAPGRNVAALPNNDITRASVSAAGLEGDGASTSPSVNSDGSVVAFTSAASNLTLSDANNKKDVFLKIRSTGAITRITGANEGNADSINPSISKESGGRFTVFESASTSLVNTLTNGITNIYRYDRTIPQLILISLANAGPGNGNSTHAAVSSTGEFVAFQSKATNLISTVESKTFSDIYLYDSANAGTPIVRISNTPGFQEPSGDSTAPSMSADGRYITYQTAATDISATPDTNGKSDIFLFDRIGGTTTLLSHKISSTETANGDSTAPAVSSSGNVVVFVSNATNLVSNTSSTKTAIYLYNIGSGAISLIDRDLTGEKCDGNSSAPSVSGNGRYVAFVSDCSQLITADTNSSPDLFIYDSVAGKVTSRKNLTTGLLQTTGGVGASSVSDDGSVVAFDSGATTLVPADTNKASDVFVTDTNCPTDSDSDGTKDCQDACPFDPTKTSPGVCGCGSPDVDTDHDGALDCADTCPVDPSKQYGADCPCGVADVDNNGNGVSDCKDPLITTVPGRAVVSYKRGKRHLVVELPSQFTNVTYKIQLLKGDKVLSSISCTTLDSYFTNLQTGRYTIRYKAGVPPAFSKFSNSRIISLKDRARPTRTVGVCGKEPAI